MSKTKEKSGLANPSQYVGKRFVEKKKGGRTGMITMHNPVKKRFRLSLDPDRNREKINIPEDELLEKWKPESE